MSQDIIFSDNNLGSFIENDFGDRILYAVNGASFNKIGAHAVYRNHWGDNLFVEDTLYLIVGTDAGILPTYIQRIGIPEGSRYLFIELEEVIPYVDSLFSDNDLADGKLTLCTAEQWKVTAQSLSLAEYAYLDSVKLFASVAVSDAHLIAYHEFWRELEKDFQREIWRFQKEFGNLTFISRHIENLAENRISASVLRNSLKGKTAVLLAGGPSLDDILPWVQQHRKHLTLVAVSRISKRLLHFGIEPDIVVTVDPHLCSYEVSKHMLLFDSAVLVNAYHATPLLLGQWQGRSYYLDHRYPWRNDEGEIVAGAPPTVSNSAINLCIAMGFSQVIFAGLDLCFSQEGYSHAKDSLERNTGAFVAYATQIVETNEGKQAETDTGFYNSISVIAEQAKLASKNGTKLINPSPSAAKIDNVEHSSLEQIDLPAEEYDAADYIHQVSPEDNSDTRRKLYQSTLEEISRIEAKIEKLTSYAKQGLKYNDGLFGRNGLKKSFKYKIKMDKLEKKINKELIEIASIAKIYGMADFVKTLRPDPSREWTDEEIEANGKLYYQAYVDGATKLSKVISESVERLHHRLEEESEKPEIEKLCAYWQKDHTLGRARLWKKTHANAYQKLDEPKREQIDALCDQFSLEIENDDLAHRKTIQRYADLSPVIGKLQKLMHQRDVVSLRRLLLGLETRQEDEAKYLAILVQAHIAECEEDMQLAIDDYRQLIELNPAQYTRIIEVALVRLSILSMNCGELKLAADCLDNLSKISFAYMPYYAEALRLSNQIQQAIDIYTGYLSKVPEDLASMMKLGILYKSIGVKEGAAWVFDYIYKKDPQNSAAKRLLDELELSA